MRTLTLLGLLLAVSLVKLNAQAAPAATTPPSTTPLGSFYEYKVNSLDGKPTDLAKYKGSVSLVVNVASRCGNTPQYAGLVKLQDEYRDKGLNILAFPSNDFGQQEPGSAQEITEFCTTKYHVNFPMFEKIDVKGDTKTPVYQFLTSGFPEPNWNFAKYLVGRDGKVIKFYEAGTQPDNAALKADIDAAINAK